MSVIKAEIDPRPMPLIGHIHALDDLCVEVTWSAGTRAGRTEIIDLSPIINRYRVYAPLRARPDVFGTVSVENDGQLLEWANGHFDMPATNVEYLAEQQMTGREFVSFMERHDLTRAETAAELGRSLRCIQDYVRFEGPIPRTVALACKGYEAGLHQEWSLDARAIEQWTTEALFACEKAQAPSNDYLLTYSLPAQVKKFA